MFIPFHKLREKETKNKIKKGEEKMSSKKKLIISLSAVCLVAVIAVVAVVAVLAAGQQIVASTIRVTYTATDVSAAVSANQYLLDSKLTGSAEAFKVGDTDQTRLVFAAKDAGPVEGAATGTLTQPGTDGIALTSSNNTVVFEFKFENLSTSVPYKVTIADAEFSPSLEVTFLSTDTQIVYTEAANTVGTISAGSLAEFEVPVAEATDTPSVMYAYIKISLDEEKISDNIESTAAIKWTLDAVAPETGD